MSETSVAQIAEISAKSTDGFEDAIRTGLERAQKTLRHVTSAWITRAARDRQQRQSGHQVNMEVTFS